MDLLIYLIPIFAIFSMNRAFKYGTGRQRYWGFVPIAIVASTYGYLTSSGGSGSFDTNMASFGTTLLVLIVAVPLAIVSSALLVINFRPRAK